MQKHQILMYDAILDGDAKQFLAQIKAAGNAPIELRINSPGGSVFEGYAIYNALIAHAPGVTVYIDALAASIAAYIAMAGKEIIMAENAMLMIHNPTSSSAGDADAARKTAELLDKVTESIIAAHAQKTGLPGERIRAMMDDETWLTADMAKELGFIDTVAAPLQVAACFNLARFRNAPASLLKPETALNRGGALTDYAEWSARLDALDGVERQQFYQDHQAEIDAAFARSQESQAAAKTTLTGAVDSVPEIRAIVLERDTLRGQVVSLNKLCAALTKERDHQASLVSLIEGFATQHGLNLTGVDRNAAVGMPNVAGPSKDYLQWSAELNALSGVEYTEFYRTHQAEIDAAHARFKKLHPVA